MFSNYEHLLQHPHDLRGHHSAGRGTLTTAPRCSWAPERASSCRRADLVCLLQAVCRWVEQARERLRRFCSESLPLFFLIMWVVVIGVVGSAFIVKILDLFFPSCEHKWVESDAVCESIFALCLTPCFPFSRHIFHLKPVALVPEDEKHNLLENVEVEDVEDEKKPWRRTN